MTDSKDVEDVIIETITEVGWPWLLLAFALGVAGGIVVIAFIGRERVMEE